MSFSFKNIVTPTAEYSWGNAVHPHVLLDPSKLKLYIATAKKADGKAYLVEMDFEGNARELQLQMATGPDPTFGAGDCHIIPAILWLNETRKKIVAIGGEHVGSTIQIEIIDVDSWTSEKVIDTGIDGTYHILIRKSDGRIIFFYRRNTDGYIHYAVYDPSNDSVSTPVQVTNAETKIITVGYDYDSGKYIIGLSPDYEKFALLLFDPETETFTDLQGNPVTLPVNPSSMPLIYAWAQIHVVKRNNYVYSYRTVDIDNDGNDEAVLLKYDVNGNLVAHRILADDVDVTNYHWDDYSAHIFVWNGKYRAFASLPPAIKVFEFDDQLNITEIASFTPTYPALRPRVAVVDMRHDAWELTTHFVSGIDDHDFTKPIDELSNPDYLQALIIRQVTQLSLQVTPL